MAGALEGDLFIGPKAEEHRGLLSIKYPMEHGVVTDWNDMERIWQYVYSKDQLQTFSEEVSPWNIWIQVVINRDCLLIYPDSLFDSSIQCFWRKRRLIQEEIGRNLPKYSLKL